MYRFKSIWIIVIIVLVQSCTDPLSVFDQNKPVPNHNWAYVNRVRYNVKIDDPSIPYNIYFNLRVTGGYKYSNIFVLFFESGVNNSTVKTRHEFKLASPDGEWLGSGSGNLYSYQLPLLIGHKFPATGVYHFEVEQNMRDNPLHEVSDIGLRVEKMK
ncbi:gliding motility lipoprotein GldH [Mucilaginibacter segetis]|uniref:Gliding motility lipoprotein GldH n=1 Tax=Mucilaginibacter segetis TaxID=2793071 RepID=A0A934PSH9_9SPHI|nr:gliding motility lipoprotein GldH [Mucilaginibacter segetis]MBK0379999.1 gliding motility lipoprotein GldH [Mucilaginibacter segetis]